MKRLKLLLATTTMLSAGGLWADTAQPVFRDPPLVRHIYTADPSAHVFAGKIYIYPSHDIENQVPDSNDGDQYAMRDYHVFSMDHIGGEVIDHGSVLSVNQIPWASRQLWAPDAAFAHGRYYLYFPARDQNGIFRIGVAISDSPSGPFKPEEAPINGTYSIDPAVFGDRDGSFYLYFGGLMGGQLQNWSNNTFTSHAPLPKGSQPPAAPRIARLTPDMLSLAEPPKEIQILDTDGRIIPAGDEDRRFFEAAWVHRYNDTYYFSYSTGTTHKICYATGKSPYGPFNYRGVILNPVKGWTTHHSIVQIDGKWYLFYHDSELSGQSNLRNIKVTELHYNPDGSIQTIDSYSYR